MAKIFCLRQRSMKVMNEGKIIPGTVIHWRGGGRDQGIYLMQAAATRTFGLKIYQRARENERPAARKFQVIMIRLLSSGFKFMPSFKRLPPITAATSSWLTGALKKIGEVLFIVMPGTTLERRFAAQSSNFQDDLLKLWGRTGAVSGYPLSIP
ncbi:hypothetical protein B0H19DRAFT_1077860 [Mycena capillaripes]|nr:hypothetical protein B0H19DRAFT_1077860 [Mycena capillaripes]